jgi:hypothetical protein
VRAELGLRPDDFVIVYTGTIHAANLADMRRLYVALAALRRDGHPIVFVKTGWDSPEAPELRQLGDALRNLGWLPRASLPDLLGAADAFVQPDAPGPFNDFRFPAKVPDFLASGKPVVVGRTNIGLVLEDGREALVLENGASTEIYRAVELLCADAELARKIGQGGRAFALRELRWSTSGDALEALHREVSSAEAPPVSALELDPPVKVVAYVSEPPPPEHARKARRYGVYALCDFPKAQAGRYVVTFPHDTDNIQEYEAELRRAVLRALARADVEDPIVFVDPSGDVSRGVWLRATRAAIRAGIRQYYTARRLRLGRRAIDETFRFA